MIEKQVREYVINGCSGAIQIVSVDGWNESSLSYSAFELALRDILSPKTLKINKDNGTISPSTPQEWEWLEAAAKNQSNYKFKVNGQQAAYASSLFCGVFSDGTPARDLRNWREIRIEQKQTDDQRRAAGYGNSRMGGWIER